MPSTSYVAGVLAILLGGLALLTWATDGWRAFSAEQARRLSVMADPRPLPSVTLDEAGGGSLALSEDLRGRYAVVDFIYTGCAHACTTLGATFRSLQADLDEALLGDEVVFVSVTFDPDNDDRERLRRYGERFDANPEHWHLARPRDEIDLEQLLSRFGVIAIPDGGEFVHNAAIYVVDPHGRLVRIFELDDPDGVRHYLETQL